MPNETKKYPTYKALAAAFATGELDRTKYKLCLDNDNARLSRTDLEDVDGNDEDAAAEEKAQELFEGYGCYYEDVLEMLAAAGIPAESP